MSLNEVPEGYTGVILAADQSNVALSPRWCARAYVGGDIVASSSGKTEAASEMLTIATMLCNEIGRLRKQAWVQEVAGTSLEGE